MNPRATHRGGPPGALSARRWRWTVRTVFAGAALATAAPVLAQDGNYVRPVTEIEDRLRDGGMAIKEWLLALEK